MSWENIAEAQRARVLQATQAAALLLPSTLSDLSRDVSSIPATCGLLTPKQLDIVELDATGIRDAVLAKKFSAVEVVEAVGKTAAIAHQLTSCLTDFFLSEAIEDAKKLDEHLAKTGKPVGALHGVPVSIKDTFDVTGKETSGSFTAWIGHKVAKENAQVVQILRDAGAILYCKTNLPQTVMHLESHSFWGRTLNPFNRDLTAGGSSGGESALIAMRGSPLGVGTDIGGSVRSPAACCGIYTLRPTIGRVPASGSRSSQPGRDSIVAVAGPMARSARDVSLFMSAVLSASPHLNDPLLSDKPWALHPAGAVWERENRKLRVGVMWDDRVVVPQPPIRRALRWAVDALRATRNIELVDFEPWEHEKGYDIIRDLYFPDGGKRIREILAETGEPLFPLTEWVLEPARDHTQHEMWEAHVRRDAYRKDYLKHWNTSKVDVVLCPVGPGPAPAHDTAKYWGYTAQWNLLDYPCAVFPTPLRASAELDPVDQNFQPLVQHDRINHEAYASEVFENAPLCLQVVGRRWGDEEVMRALEVIEGALGKDGA